MNDFDIVLKKRGCYVRCRRVDAVSEVGFRRSTEVRSAQGGFTRFGLPASQGAGLLGPLDEGE